jgi:hypothetical protein
MSDIFQLMQFFIDYSLWFAIPSRILSMLGNSFCDAIIFSKAYGKQGNLWHWIKYGIDKLFHGLFWFATFAIIYRECYNDMWHYTNEFLIWLAVYLTGFFIWQINYRFWKKYWNKK